MSTAAVDRGDVVEVIEDKPVVAEPEKVEPTDEEKIAAELAEKEAADKAAAEKAAAEKEAAEKAEKDKPEARIPKARFDEAVGKERSAREAAEARVAKLEAELEGRKETADQSAQKAKIDEMEASIDDLTKKHAQFLLDGDAEAAAKAMREIRTAERSIARMESQADTTVVTQQVLESEKMNLAIAQLERDFPVMNPNSEEFDESLVNFALAEQVRLIKNEGLTPSQALIKATTNVVERFAKPAETKPAKDEPKGLDKAAEDRKQAQIAKNLADSKAQPAGLKDVGMDTDKMGQKPLPKYSEMTDAEKKALPESVKARMRGDEL